MKKNNTISENISAYVDGELSPDDIQNIESKINSSLELKNELDYLNKIKQLTASSIHLLNESPYFETRLLASLKVENNVGTKLKRWSPALIIGSLTIALMIFFKFNPNIIENLFEQQKTKIAGFYKENLRPLLFAADVSDEDIFDFAFYSKLPLDKAQGQYLLLGYDDNGNGIFEIKNIDRNQHNIDLQKFKSALELSSRQSEQIDSIIQMYTTAIEPLILVNDKNTVAVNPGLWSYQKAMLADILSFAENSNKQKFKDIMPAGFSFASNTDVGNMVRQVKNLHNDNYIFLTPDSIFSEQFEFDQNEFNKDIKAMKEELKNYKKGSANLKSFTFRFDSSLFNFNTDGKFEKEIMVFIDSNECRVHIPKIQIPIIRLPNMDSLSSMIEEVTKNFENFTFVLPEIPEIQSDNFNFDITIPNVDSILLENKVFTDSSDMINFQDFPLQGDSLQKYLNKFFHEYQKDGTKDGNMNEEFESLQKEMENLRREMERWRNKLDQKQEKQEDAIIEI